MEPLAIVLGFSFWHNGFYYYTRSKLDDAYEGFMDQSETTSAKTSLSFLGRLIAFVVSLILISIITI